MTLRDVLSGAGIKVAIPEPLAGTAVRGLAYDSRQCGEGCLFFAFPGHKTDGRKFADDALSRGAVAVVSECPRPDDFAGPWLEVEHGRQALAVAARNFFGKPDTRLGLTGITGTNGKTTTSYLLDSILRTAGHTTAMIGTIEYHMAGKVVPALNTTPESLELFRLFSELEQVGGSHATMEVSSHGLALGRVFAIQFHTAVFTNLTRDHLDFHRTMDEYFQAKHFLFEGAGATPPQFAILNADDAYGRQIQASPKTQVLRYGLGENADVRARGIAAGFDGLRFELRFPGGSIPIRSALPGRMNVYNILAASGAALTYGLNPEIIARGIADCLSVPGRFEKVEEGQPFLVVVDYAHTDDALRNVIGVARQLNPARIITVFGCGGDRDRAKRPLMGSVAAELSDFVILTSDNPRSEDPLAIMNDASVGLRRHDTPHITEPDRQKAIRRAIEQARAGDVVIVAGKGHETYQVLKDKTIHFDDREVAREVLRSFGYQRAKA